MKKQLLFILTAATLMAACGSREKKITVTDDASGDKTSVTITPGNISVNTNDVTAKLEELKKLTPVSTETLKSFFPEEVMGMKRTSFNVSSAMGYAVGTAEYEKDDNKSYNVGIYDCAGDAGSAFYTMSYLGRMNMETENDNGYSKSVDVMGTRGIEAFDKSSNKHTLMFMSADRFWVTIDGNDGLDNLKSFGNALSLDKLKGAK